MSRARVGPAVRQSASVELHLIGAEQLSAQRRLIIDAICAGLLGAQAVWQSGCRSEIRSQGESAVHRVRTITADLISVRRNYGRVAASCKKTMMVLNHCPVALAGGRLKRSAVEYGDFAAGIADHLVSLQRARGDGHGASLYAQHVSEVLVREMKMVCVCAVVRQQQPVRKALLDLMEAGTCDCSRLLRQ